MLQAHSAFALWQQTPATIHIAFPWPTQERSPTFVLTSSKLRKFHRGATGFQFKLPGDLSSARSHNLKGEEA
jgi:hypothetical protein